MAEEAEEKVEAERAEEKMEVFRLAFAGCFFDEQL